MTPAKTFNPTQEQIKAAERLFLAMAFHQTIKPVFQQMESDLIATGQYHFSDLYYTQKWIDIYAKRGITLPADRVITDVKDVCHMDGLTVTPVTGDAEKYYAEFRKLALYNGFIAGENAECKADNEVRQAQNAFIEATEAIHGVKLDNIVYMDHRKQLIDLTSSLFSGLLDKVRLKEAQLQYYNERIGIAI